MKIAFLQTDMGRDREKNIEILAHLAQKTNGADLVITPECTNLMGYWPAQDELFTVEEEPVVKAAQSWAKDNSTPVILGSVLVRDEERDGSVNRQLLINNKGEIAAQYDKIHMFDVDLPNGESFHESQKFLAGEQALVSEVGGIKIGHSICFDLRFPPLYRVLSQSGAEVLIVPAAFTKLTGRAHWSTLLRARAIENGAYVIAPAQCGQYVHFDGSTRANWGHSMAVSPWGEVLVELGEDADIGMVNINPARVKDARTQIPSLGADQKYSKP